MPKNIPMVIKILRLRYLVSEEKELSGKKSVQDQGAGAW